MEAKDPEFECALCHASWTIWGIIDITKLNSTLPHCPVCGVVLQIKESIKDA